MFFPTSGTLRTTTDAPPLQFVNFVTLKLTNPFNESVDPNNLAYLGYRFLLPASAAHQLAYVFNEAAIYCFSGNLWPRSFARASVVVDVR